MFVKHDCRYRILITKASCVQASPAMEPRGKCSDKTHTSCRLLSGSFAEFAVNSTSASAAAGTTSSVRRAKPPHNGLLGIVFISKEVTMPKLLPPPFRQRNRSLKCQL